MRRTAIDRRERPPLLTRRPRIDRQALQPRTQVVNGVDQYRALIALTDRGLLSAQELAQQVRWIGKD